MSSTDQSKPSVDADSTAPVARPFIAALRVVLGLGVLLLFSVVALVILIPLGTALSNDVPFAWGYIALQFSLVVGAVSGGMLVFKVRRGRIGLNLSLGLVALLLSFDLFRSGSAGGLEIFVFGFLAVLALIVNDRRMREHLDSAEPFFDRETGVATLKLGLVGAVALAVLVAFGLEVGDVRRELAIHRAESLCTESSNPDRCVDYARTLFIKGTEPSDVSKAFEVLREQCEAEGAHPSHCREYMIRTTPTFTRDGGLSDVLSDHIARKAREGCHSGDSIGCFVWGWDGEDLGPENISKVRTACRDDGDRHACWVLQAATPKDTRELDDFMAACRSGVVLGCEKIRVSEHASAADRLRAIETACESDTSPWLCRKWPGAAQAADQPLEHERIRDICWNGGRQACRLEHYEVAADHPHSEALATALQVMASSGNDPAFWDAIPDPDFDFGAACSDGVAEACFVAGLQIMPPFPGYKPPLPKMQRLRETFGRACDLGMNAACIALAVRLLDRPVGERVDPKPATDLLEQTCDRESRVACWLVPPPPGTSPTQPDEITEQLERGCFASVDGGSNSPCEDYRGVLAFERGWSPVALTSRISYRHQLEYCRANEAISCNQIAWMWSGRGAPLASAMPPYRVRAFDAAAKTCVGGVDWACEQLLRNERKWPGHTEERAATLRRQVCAQNEEMCDVVKGAAR